MRLSKNHVDYISFLVFKALKEHPNVTLNNPDDAVSTVRRRLFENLKLEQELEEEAKRLLEPHKADIIREGADYARMVKEGKRSLAKKRGIVL